MSTFFITGGTGSLGSRLVDWILHHGQEEHKVVIFSRDEQKQYQMRLRYANDEQKENMSFVIGDVRDKSAVHKTFDLYHPDYVIHTAAQKHVRVCDENPEQAVLTNIHGTQNVLDASIAHSVSGFCFVSTDKAVNPTTLYGMTKAIAERLVRNAHDRQENTKVSAVRYGNVINSAGSLIPLYLSIAESAKRTLTKPVFPLTDDEMTRFFITFNDAITTIIYAMGIEMILEVPSDDYIIYDDAHDGLFFIPSLSSARIKDIARIFATKCGGSIQKIPMYPNEKIHEILTPTYSSGDKNNLMSRKEVEKFLEREGLLPSCR
jgi:FlaA1/EpsC-like NDP-sugar epimerase